MKLNEAWAPPAYPRRWGVNETSCGAERWAAGALPYAGNLISALIENTALHSTLANQRVWNSGGKVCVTGRFPSSPSSHSSLCHLPSPLKILLPPCSSSPLTILRESPLLPIPSWVTSHWPSPFPSLYHTPSPLYILLPYQSPTTIKSPPSPLPHSSRHLLFPLIPRPYNPSFPTLLKASPPFIILYPSHLP